MSTFGQHFKGYTECQTAQYLGCSYALKGDHRKAHEAIERLESRLLGGIPEWMVQAWLFAKADILILIGSHSQALETGLHALGRGGPVLQSAFFAGEFARWLALTSRMTSREPDARTLIANMTTVLEAFDAMDQVEILCADILLNCGHEYDNQVSRTRIAEKLAHLPSSTSHFLARLGVLSHGF
jgi:hypothetical protein